MLIEKKKLREEENSNIAGTSILLLKEQYIDDQLVSTDSLGAQHWGVSMLMGRLIMASSSPLQCI